MASKIRPRLVFADKNGRIFDHPDLVMLCRRGNEFSLPRPSELTPLPPESELFLLPKRHALGFDPETGEVERLEDTAVAAFVQPGYTLTGLSAYETGEDAPRLPLFAYGAVGFAKDRFWVCAKQVDTDKRQEFSNIPKKRIQDRAWKWLKSYPDNRLVGHLMSKCALTYSCPAARNLALGRFEAPLPTSRTCNARCVGCLSLQPEDSGFPCTQTRISFTPTAKEIVEVMAGHAKNEKKPVYSFGQGCEGEPLTEAGIIAEAVSKFRDQGGIGTVNINTNASLPGTIEPLAKAGLTSIRVSLSSARPKPYAAYHRPVNYTFQDVFGTIKEAKKYGLFVSLNLFFFPGLSDSEEEMAALKDLVGGLHVDFIQLRNLNLDPEIYLDVMKDFSFGPSMGLLNFKKRLKKACPWLEFGYFNPYLG